MNREVMLVSQLIGAGATALGQASYATGIGKYYSAFFGLSIGFERLAKLVLVADYALKNAGALPDEKLISSYKHNLITLANEVEGISNQRRMRLEYARPTGEIPNAIVECLGGFADAKKGRYANFNALGTPNFKKTDEPIQQWWAEVVVPILAKHYRGKNSETLVKQRAKTIDRLYGYFDESEKRMSSFEAAWVRSGETNYAQKYCRFYVLTIARWMMDVFSELTALTGHTQGFEILSGHYEIFGPYLNKNKLLLTLKRWPPH